MSVIDFESYRRRKSEANDAAALQSADESLRTMVVEHQKQTLRELAAIVGADASRVDAQAELIGDAVVRMCNPPSLQAEIAIPAEWGEEWDRRMGAEFTRYCQAIANRVKEHCVLEFLTVTSDLCLPLPGR